MTPAAIQADEANRTSNRTLLVIPAEVSRYLLRILVPAVTVIIALAWIGFGVFLACHSCAW